MQNETTLRLNKPPIIEAVLDIDCDMPPLEDVNVLEKSMFEKLRDKYPKVRRAFLQQHYFNLPEGKPEHSTQTVVQAIHFFHEDEKQLVQARPQEGYSFNRLAPYGSLDDYLPEIERTWAIFNEQAKPIQIKAIKLRYINRILLPFKDRRLELSDYIRNSPKLPDNCGLAFAGLLSQQIGIEQNTGHVAQMVLNMQGHNDDNVAFIYDLTVISQNGEKPEQWAWISDQIKALRALKNRIFWNTFTERCLSLFQ